MLSLPSSWPGDHTLGTAGFEDGVESGRPVRKLCWTGPEPEAEQGQQGQQGGCRAFLRGGAPERCPGGCGHEGERGV